MRYSSFVLCELVWEYYCWQAANTLNISVFYALSIGSGLVAAVLLCIKRGQIEKNNIHRLILSPNSKIYNDSQ